MLLSIFKNSIVPGLKKKIVSNKQSNKKNDNRSKKSNNSVELKYFINDIGKLNVVTQITQFFPL